MFQIWNTLVTYLSKKEKNMKNYQHSDLMLKKKRSRLSNYEDVDNALLLWFKPKHEDGLCL